MNEHKDEEDIDYRQYNVVKDLSHDQWLDGNYIITDSGKILVPKDKADDLSWD